MGWFRKTFNFLDPGPSRFNDRPAFFGASPNPYDPSVQWDPQGFPVGPMPRGEFALEYQYEANRRTDARRQALWSDAQNTLRQGLDLFQSYRPGGSAALASGLFQQRAGLYGQQAQSLESPDLLIDYRRDAQAKADIEARRAQRFSQVMGALQLGASVAGAAAGAAAGVPVPPTGPAPVGPTTPGGQAPMPEAQPQGYGAQIGPTTPSMPATLPMGAEGAPWTPGAAFSQGMNRAMGATMAPEGGGGGGGMAQGGGGGGQKRRGPAGGRPDGGGGGPAGAAGPGGGLGGVGVGADGNFTQTAVAANAAASSPVMTPLLTEEWAEDEGRRAKTAMMVMAATRELAMAY